MAISAMLGVRRNLGYVGAHVSLLAGAIGLLFLQRYIWLLKIAEQGYGPYQTVSDITTISVIFILADLLVLRWALRGSRSDKSISLLWPAFFFVTALFVFLGNNL